MTTTLGSDPTAVQSIDETPEEALAREAAEAPAVETMVRAAISMRGHLVAALTTMREMADAAKSGDIKSLKMLGIEAEALIAENQMLGMSIDRVPSMPAPGSRVTPDLVETIFGIQRARIAARDANKTKKVGR
jgi:hypothetical protein